MSDNKLSWLISVTVTVLVTSLSFAVGYCSVDTYYSAETETVKDSTEHRQDTIVLTDLEMSKENFFLVCESLSIKFPEVVYAQARLESGNFTSSHYKNRNNFLGLYDSRRMQYMRFDHWTECLLAYRDKVQYRYKRNSDREDYLRWLAETGYAEDPDYISKVRKMLK